MSDSEEGSSSSSGGSRWVKSVKKKSDDPLEMLEPISNEVEKLPGNEGRKEEQGPRRSQRVAGVEGSVASRGRPGVEGPHGPKDAQGPVGATALPGGVGHKEPKVPPDYVHDRGHGMSVPILFCLIAVVVAGIIADVYYDSSSTLDATDSIQHCGPGVDRSCDEYLLSRLKDLAEQHTNQNDHLWTTFYSAAYDHVRNDTSPKRPVVVMVLNDQQSTQRALIQQVADTYRSILEPQRGGGGQGGIVTIEGKELTDVESEAVQRKIKTEIEEGYESGRRAIIVYDFDLLPSCSVLTFHNFCNNEDAPYTDIAILLVVTREGPLAAEDNKNLEGAVMNKFYEKWKDCPSELPQGKIDAILSRVANNVVLLR